ncbi:hypothetical protein E2C01_088143 [Portunus trituberculatus]|uniref:Uncharacterized protein n=1 Tax=Portunus trituberculatus TaxID=210409 RepID=A0A5B7JJ33_PORTR|nr:hypothetical protein [Portunus trituberculatus]
MEDAVSDSISVSPPGNLRGTEVAQNYPRSICRYTLCLSPHSDLSNNEISEIADDAFHGLDSLNSL